MCDQSISVQEGRVPVQEFRDIGSLSWSRFASKILRVCVRVALQSSYCFVNERLAICAWQAGSMPDELAVNVFWVRSTTIDPVWIAPGQADPAAAMTRSTKTASVRR